MMPGNLYVFIQGAKSYGYMPKDEILKPLFF